MQIGYHRQDEKLFQALILCCGVNLSDQNASFSQFLYSGQFYSGALAREARRRSTMGK